MPRFPTLSIPTSLCAIALGGCLASAHAAHPLVTDDTGTQDSGNWQFEANTDHTRTREAGVTTWERELNLALTRGVTPNLDLAVNLPWLRNTTTGAAAVSGIGDATLLAKWRFFDNDSGWTLGLRPELTLPAGSESKGLGNGRATTSLTLLSQLEQGAWTWLANAGVTYNDNQAGDRKHLWAASTAVVYSISDAWKLAADIGIARAAAPGARNEKYTLVGLIHPMGDALDLDIGWRHAKGDGALASTLGVGLTLRW